MQPFERGLDQGIAMIITDQGIQEEADALGLHIITQAEFTAGILNGTQAATFAHALTGKSEGIIVLGNGKNVSPGPMEAALSSSRFVAQAVILGDGQPYTGALIAPDFDS